MFFTWKEDLAVLIAIVLGSIIIATLAVVPLYFKSKAECNVFNSTIADETNHSFSAGCLIKIEGTWYTKNEINSGMRLVLPTKEKE